MVPSLNMWLFPMFHGFSEVVGTQYINAQYWFFFLLDSDTLCNISAILFETSMQVAKDSATATANCSERCDLFE